MKTTAIPQELERKGWQSLAELPHGRQMKIHKITAWNIFMFYTDSCRDGNFAT